MASGLLTGGHSRAYRSDNFSIREKMKKLIPACQSGLTFLFVSHLLALRHLREIKSVQGKFDYQRKGEQ